ncbi:hypothetical protein [Ornithinimicrobium kibberense]|uniref:hypothetical protein n=1 Tax=Ornithinimicrobium kibberense TaxID=282060 RepID=UPI00361E192B
MWTTTVFSSPSSRCASDSVKADTQITVSADRSSAGAASAGRSSSGSSQATTSWRVRTSGPGGGGRSRSIR